MKFAISTITGTMFTMTITPFYVHGRKQYGIDKARCIEHIKAIVGHDAIVVEIKE